MAFKVVDVLGVSLAVDYEEMARQAGVELELAQNFCSLEATEEEIIAAAKDADAVIAQSAYQPFSRQVLSNLDNCRFLMSVGSGYDRLDVEAATELGILTANIPDFCLEEMSDHTMALILACTRRITQLNDTVKQGKWKPMPDPFIVNEMWPKMSSLRGKTLGLVGFGRIAQAVVPKAKCFGLRIIAYYPRMTPDMLRSYEVEQVELDELLDQADIVSLHVPLTAETTHLLGREQLKRMKPAAHLINTARGAIVDHDALYTALSEGHIAMAAVDVTDPEPLPPDSPLLKLDNFIVTAHSAHAYSAASPGLSQRPGEELIRVIKGEWPVGLINPQVKEKHRQQWQ